MKPSSSTPYGETTAPASIGNCLRCGYPIYQGLAHHCITAPMIATRSPYDLNGLEEYPGD